MCRFKTLFLIGLWQLALLFAPILALSSVGVPARAQSVSELISPAVVKLTIRFHGIATLSGTGFFTSADGSIVTNRHVLRNLIHENGYTLEVTPFNQKPREVPKFEVGSCGEMSAADLCLIHADIKPARYLSLSAHPPLAGDSAFTVGNPRNHDFAFSSGKIKSIAFDLYGIEEFTLTTPLGPGSSGGPIVNYKGELIGVASKYSSSHTGENYALSFSELRKFLSAKSSFVSVAVARGRIAKSMQIRMETNWKTQIERKDPETIQHSFKFDDEMVTVALPKIFDKCREIESPDLRGAINACVGAGDASLFMVQRFDAQKSNPMISGRTLLHSRRHAPRRLEAFDSKPLPAKCGHAKSGVFNRDRACAFTVLNDTEPSAQSKNLWVQHGARIYSFSTWMADPNQAGFYGELPAYVARTVQILKTKNVAQAATKMPALTPFELPQPEPLRFHSPLLSSSQDH